MILKPPLGRIRVFLGDQPAGDLTVYPDDRTEFTLSSDYLSLYPRPVLGQTFEDNLERTHSSRMQLPPFFSNLLPEEKNRDLIALQLGVSPKREAHLLAYLGEDLPGNVRAVADGELPDVSAEHTPPLPTGLQHPIKFSLAGAQPKLSMFRAPDGLTFPSTGAGGDLLVKTPGTRYRGVPENEFFTMGWARASGIQVPDHWLEPVARLHNVPPELSEDSGYAFVVARFDRPEPGRRIHIEDFAQVLGFYGDYASKYRKTNYETIANVIWSLHRPSFDEFLRRLVFVAMSANGDAHAKNWSLWYPDGVHPELSPAYDLVSTIEFIEEDTLGLNLAGSKTWPEVSLASFEQLATRIGADPAHVAAVVREAVAKTRAAWEARKKEASETLVKRLEKHWQRMPLANAG
jgi:serine/threonine-protein kinase HipA